MPPPPNHCFLHLSLSRSIWPRAASWWRHSAHPSSLTWSSTSKLTDTSTAQTFQRLQRSLTWLYSPAQIFLRLSLPPTYRNVLCVGIVRTACSLNDTKCTPPLPLFLLYTYFPLMDCIYAIPSTGCNLALRINESSHVPVLFMYLPFVDLGWWESGPNVWCWLLLLCETALYNNYLMAFNGCTAQWPCFFRLLLEKGIQVLSLFSSCFSSLQQPPVYRLCGATLWREEWAAITEYGRTGSLYFWSPAMNLYIFILAPFTCWIWQYTAWVAV